MMSFDRPDLRIISLIPSATEIIDALGLSSALVGRSHECDYPPGLETVPVCTAPNLDPSKSSAEIHDQVEDLLRNALSIYAVDPAQLAQLRPTHIMTQAQCEVCAVSFGQVEAAVAGLAAGKPQLISLQPATFADVLNDIHSVGQRLGQPSHAVIETLNARIQSLQSRIWRTDVTVGCIEWTDPLMAAGNWVPDLVQMAGGIDRLATAGVHSSWMTWERLLEADPEVLVVMPCGFDLTATIQAVDQLSQDARWPTLQAVRSQQVFVTDGNQYFNRPGPRLVDSLEILIEILQGCDRPKYHRNGWVNWFTATKKAGG